MSEIKEVVIPAYDNHAGISSIKVKLKWICPVCSKPRGLIRHNQRSYDGSLVLSVDGWSNPCGHIDKYHMVINEALRNGLNK